MYCSVKLVTHYKCQSVISCQTVHITYALVFLGLFLFWDLLFFIFWLSCIMCTDMHFIDMCLCYCMVLELVLRWLMNIFVVVSVVMLIFIFLGPISFAHSLLDHLFLSGNGNKWKGGGRDVLGKRKDITISVSRFFDGRYQYVTFLWWEIPVCSISFMGTQFVWLKFVEVSDGNIIGESKCHWYLKYKPNITDRTWGRMNVTDGSTGGWGWGGVITDSSVEQTKHHR